MIGESFQHGLLPGARSAPLVELVTEHQRAPVREIGHGPRLKPLVSVVVTTYQHAPFVAQCLDSILAQQFDADFEILVGEDDSDDQTRAICLDYAARFPERIRLFLHDPANKIRIHGIATGRFNLTYLLSRARGEFICLCEGDDYWRDPGKLRKQVGALRAAPEAVMVFTNSIILRNDEPSGELFLAPGQQRDIDREELATGARIPTQSIMFRNVFATQPVPADFFRAFNGDSFLFSHLSCFGVAKYLGTVVPCAYRIHQGGMWSALDEERRMMLAIDTKRIVRRLHGSAPIQRRLDEGIFRITVSLAKLHLAHGDLHKAARAAWQLLVLLFKQPRLYSMLIGSKLRNRLHGLAGRAGHAQN